MFFQPEMRKLLTQKAHLFLGQAEARFGLRQPGWTFTGVFFEEHGPCLWFPTRARGEIEIHVTLSTAKNPDQAAYQLAHEVVHMLAPDRNPPACMLEEGVATLFSLDGPTFQNPAYRPGALRYLAERPDMIHYNEALRLVRELLAIEPDAIRLLRQIEPRFYAMSATMIVARLPRVPIPLARRLVEKRQMR